MLALFYPPLHPRPPSSPPPTSHSLQVLLLLWHHSRSLASAQGHRSSTRSHANTIARSLARMHAHTCRSASLRARSTHAQAPIACARTHSTHANLTRSNTRTPHARTLAAYTHARSRVHSTTIMPTKCQYAGSFPCALVRVLSVANAIIRALRHAHPRTLAAHPRTLAAHPRGHLHTCQKAPRSTRTVLAPRNS
jgi:hypothetical protein